MHADGADQVYGGEITIKTCYEGIEGQNMESSGGTIDITASDNGNGALDYNGTATITGGTLVAAGMSGMEQNFGSDSTQGSLMMNLTDNQSGEITLEDADGNTLVSYTPMREYNSVVISCAELSDGSTYTIHTGENSREVTMEGLVYTDGEVTNAPGQGNPPDTQNGDRPQGDAPQGNPGDSSKEQTKEESDGQK